MYVSDAGYLLTAVACFQIPYWMMQAAFMQKGDECTRVSSKLLMGILGENDCYLFCQKFIDSWKPSLEWGPKNAQTREEWMKSETDYQMERLFEKQN